MVMPAIDFDEALGTILRGACPIEYRQEFPHCEASCDWETCSDDTATFAGTASAGKL
jgi:hypothetical protein